MKNLCLITATVFSVSGCAVVKIPSITGTNRDEGKIQMTYNYGALERPQVKWDDALVSANAQCKSWGYQDAQQTSAPQSACVQNNQQGNCISWKVDTLYDCKLSPEQQAVLNDKKQKAIQLQQEEQKKAEKAQQTLINNLKHFKIVFMCEEKYPGSGSAKDYAKSVMKAYISGGDSYYASLLKSYKCSSESSEVSWSHRGIQKGTIYYNDGSKVYYLYNSSIKDDGVEFSIGLVGW